MKSKKTSTLPSPAALSAPRAVSRGGLPPMAFLPAAGAPPFRAAADLPVGTRMTGEWSQVIRSYASLMPATSALSLPPYQVLQGVQAITPSVVQPTSIVGSPSVHLVAPTILPTTRVAARSISSSPDDPAASAKSSTKQPTHISIAPAPARCGTQTTLLPVFREQPMRVHPTPEPNNRASYSHVAPIAKRRPVLRADACRCGLTLIRHTDALDFVAIQDLLGVMAVAAYATDPHEGTSNPKTQRLTKYLIRELNKRAYATVYWGDRRSAPLVGRDAAIAIAASFAAEPRVLEQAPEIARYITTPDYQGMLACPSMPIGDSKSIPSAVASDTTSPGAIAVDAAVATACVQDETMAAIKPTETVALAARRLRVRSTTSTPISHSYLIHADENARGDGDVGPRSSFASSSSSRPTNGDARPVNGSGEETEDEDADYNTRDCADDDMPENIEETGRTMNEEILATGYWDAPCPREPNSVLPRQSSVPRKRPLPGMAETPSTDGAVNVDAIFEPLPKRARNRVLCPPDEQDEESFNRALVESTMALARPDAPLVAWRSESGLWRITAVFTPSSTPALPWRVILCTWPQMPVRHGGECVWIEREHLVAKIQLLLALPSTTITTGQTCISPALGSCASASICDTWAIAAARAWLARGSLVNVHVGSRLLDRLRELQDEASSTSHAAECARLMEAVGARLDS